MIYRVYKHDKAKNDLVECFVYLAENAGVEVAERFLASAEESFSNLARSPFIGERLMLSNSALAGMRKWRVKNFNNILIFYIPRDNGVSVVRVIHASQDWWKLFGLSFVD